MWGQINSLKTFQVIGVFVFGVPAWRRSDCFVPSVENVSVICFSSFQDTNLVKLTVTPRSAFA